MKFLVKNFLEKHIPVNEVEKILKNMETQEYLDVLKNRIKEGELTNKKNCDYFKPVGKTDKLGE